MRKIKMKKKMRKKMKKKILRKPRMNSSKRIHRMTSKEGRGKSFGFKKKKKNTNPGKILCPQKNCIQFHTYGAAPQQDFKCN